MYRLLGATAGSTTHTTFGPFLSNSCNDDAHQQRRCTHWWCGKCRSNLFRQIGLELLNRNTSMKCGVHKPRLCGGVLMDSRLSRTCETFCGSSCNRSQIFRGCAIFCCIDSIEIVKRKSFRRPLRKLNQRRSSRESYGTKV